MDRPPIEEWRRVWKRMGTDLFESEIQLCDYALALEQEKAELERKLARSHSVLRRIAKGKMDEWFNWPEWAEQALKEE